MAKFTDPTDPGSPGDAGPQSTEAIIRLQDERHGGDSDAKLYTMARDKFDECASLLHEAINRADGARDAINAAYRISGDARIAMEVLARRWLKKKLADS